ncbi:CAF17-like 4Fe-4S cluster assembly/insertion protein YgfZ [Planctomicrobium piriforme]|uniref:Aminomethyltransferase folate-binding domain-containing protein n=1 Tax=Planctomicrobium piriforme TaxID=1576369 RepID=A0A1I3DIB6_9PLAN|nr:glycine cleavage T C-terminal barrel domain-containing protein [Planctomicrobium piriforme]SFH86406.1 hypothetical protein SAMN05421753_103253 [Planctomicrobium piriforme]
MTLPPAVSFDLSDWTQLDVSGPDARKFLHNFCTNDINGLRPGQRREAFFCDIKGRVLGHVQVFADEQRMRLIGVPGTAEKLVPHLKKYLLDADVTIVDRTAELGLLCVCGEQTAQSLSTAFGAAIEVALGQCQTLESVGGSYLIGATDVVSAPAVLISAERERLTDFRERLPDEVIALGTPELFELLRIAAAFPWYGRDLGPENIAQEAARTPQTISFTKGCYLGQEPIARLDAMGHTNKELRVLQIAGDHVQPGSAVLANGAQVGTLTSVAMGEERGRSLALGMIRTKFAAPGTELVIQSEGNEFSAMIA